MNRGNEYSDASKPIFINSNISQGFSDSSVGKESTCNAGDPSSIPGKGRSAGNEIGYPLQYSGLENSMDCTVHGVTKSQTRCSLFNISQFLYSNILFDSYNNSIRLVN